MDRRNMILGCLVGSLAGTSGSVAAQNAAGGSHRQRLEAAERAFAATMAQRDAAAFASHISRDAIFVAGGDPPQVLRGPRAIVDAWTRFFDGPDAPFSWEPDSVEVIDSGALGFTSGPVHDPQGVLAGRFNSVWRLEPDGRWRVVFDRGASVCA